MKTSATILFAALLLAALTLYREPRAQTPSDALAKYEPTVESLNRHALPDWYAGAKLGIFIHWGLYSVPGWAVLTPPGTKLSPEEYLKRNPYAEWYLNTLRIKGSPTEAYHAEHYGANYDYYNFAGTFNKEIQKWDPNQ